MVVLSLAKSVLGKNGRHVTFDGCYIDHQNRISKKFLDMDRGNFVRREEVYKKLANQVFTEVTTKIDESYFRIPYTSVIMTCAN